MAGVLVVDDSLSIRQSLKAILEDQGHRFFEAENGEEGLRLLRRYKNEIQIALIDVHMPVMNGLNMIKEVHIDVRERYPRIPLLVVTTEDDPVLRDLAKLSGVKGWCLKPVSADQIKFVLEKALNDDQKTAV